jgi:hypothetical protein
LYTVAALVSTKKTIATTMPEEETTKEPDAPVKKKQGGANRKYGQSGAAKGSAPRAPKFEGKCPDLKGHIYDASDMRQSDQFIKTTAKSESLSGERTSTAATFAMLLRNLPVL